jgi:flagellar transcriptional activator FlhC
MTMGRCLITLGDHERFERAILLIRRHVRTQIIALYTGLPANRIRALYKDIHDQAPTPGPLQQSATIIATRQRVVEASVAMTLYARLGGAAVFQEVVLDAWLKAHELYLELRRDHALPGDPIDINEMWKIVRDLRCGHVVLHSCACGCRFVTVANQLILPNCPACARQLPAAAILAAGIDIPKRPRARRRRPACDDPDSEMASGLLAQASRFPRLMAAE